MTVFLLPAHSPDLNPVERVWAHVKRRIADLAVVALRSESLAAALEGSMAERGSVKYARLLCGHGAVDARPSRVPVLRHRDAPWVGCMTLCHCPGEMGWRGAYLSSLDQLPLVRHRVPSPSSAP
ncbi:transposase [Kitasatospora sp. NBC_01250]|nr:MULTISPECIES: transposase [unclassified Kitasatospora]WSJ71725.1 transposase [Kitasatospora sp. NBC_01302]